MEKQGRWIPWLMLALCAAFTGCVSGPRTTMVGPARAAIHSPESVRIYERPPKRFQEIAIVEGRSVTELRRQAAAVGANGIIASGVVQRPGPVLGIGLGGGSYHYGRHGGVAIETDAAFDIPTGSSVLQGTAIYVP